MFEKENFQSMSIACRHTKSFNKIHIIEINVGTKFLIKPEMRGDIEVILHLEWPLAEHIATTTDRRRTREIKEWRPKVLNPTEVEKGSIN